MLSTYTQSQGGELYRLASLYSDKQGIVTIQCMVTYQQLLPSPIDALLNHTDKLRQIYSTECDSRVLSVNCHDCSCENCQSLLHCIKDGPYSSELKHLLVKRRDVVRAAVRMQQAIRIVMYAKQVIPSGSLMCKAESSGQMHLVCNSLSVCCSTCH
jgi:hypothetical protein